MFEPLYDILGSTNMDRIMYFEDYNRNINLVCAESHRLTIRHFTFLLHAYSPILREPGVICAIVVMVMKV